jgi:hypothetical protein
VKKLIIIAALLSIITAAYAQIQPETFYTSGKLAYFSGVSNDNIVVSSSHKHAIHKKHNHKNPASSKNITSFVQQENNKEEAVNYAATNDFLFVPEFGHNYLSADNEIVFKDKANLTILKTRK